MVANNIRVVFECILESLELFYSSCLDLRSESSYRVVLMRRAAPLATRSSLSRQRFSVPLLIGWI